MPVFYLIRDIDRVRDPKWLTSALKNDCWILADSPKDARDKVTTATKIAAPRAVDMAISSSPWQDEELAHCIVDDSPPRQVGMGLILTADGRTIVTIGP